MENLNDLEIRILKILEDHQGKPNAIGRFALVDRINSETPLFPVNERKIREVKTHLITQHWIAIGSCSKGYFKPITDEEIDSVAKYYDGYGLNSLFVSSRLRKIGMRDYLGQLSMKF